MRFTNIVDDGRNIGRVLIDKIPERHGVTMFGLCLSTYSEQKTLHLSEQELREHIQNCQDELHSREHGRVIHESPPKVYQVNLRVRMGYFGANVQDVNVYSAGALQDLLHREGVLRGIEPVYSDFHVFPYGRARRRRDLDEQWRADPIII